MVLHTLGAVLLGFKYVINLEEATTLITIYLKCMFLLNDATCCKPDQNRMNNKEVTDICNVEN